MSSLHVSKQLTQNNMDAKLIPQHASAHSNHNEKEIQNAVSDADFLVNYKLKAWVCASLMSIAFQLPLADRHTEWSRANWNPHMYPPPTNSPGFETVC